MREEHIIHMLEGTSFALLSESDHATIQAHTTACADCARAYKAASLSSSLLQERMTETVEPSPFFHTRIMSAIREQRNEKPAFQRLWRAAGALVSSMAAAVVLLAVSTFVIPEMQTSSVEPSTFNAYSAEEIILNEVDQAQPESDAYVLSTLYEVAEDER